MSDFVYSAQAISQHMVKVLVEIRPPLNPATDRSKLQDYANWLIETHPEAFETLVASPQQIRVNKGFGAGGRTAEVATFVMTPRGPLLQFPQRLYVGRPIDIETVNTDAIVSSALSRLGTEWFDRIAGRVCLSHEMIFHMGDQPSLEVVKANLSKERQTSEITNVRVGMEMVRDNKVLGYDIRPAYLSPNPPQAQSGGGHYGVLVNLEIRVTGVGKQGVSREQIDDLLAFSRYYVPTEMVEFLNHSL